MQNQALLDQFQSAKEAADQEVAALFGDSTATEVEGAISPVLQSFTVNNIYKGKIVGRVGNEVVVDVGMKSEGYIQVHEWDDESEIDVGDMIDVLLEAVEGETGTIVLSKRKADRIHGW